MTNYDLESTTTPLNVKMYHELLVRSKYDVELTKYLVKGFTSGFDIGHRGPTIRQSLSRNIPFQKGVGSKIEMWNKIMKEIQERRVAGPFDEIPFTNFIQSPIGLVPKAGNKTRLIFHLSYDFSDSETSLNHHTPDELCTVKYNDFDAAVQICLKASDIKLSRCGTRNIFLAKSDLVSAFRVLPISRQH